MEVLNPFEARAIAGRARAAGVCAMCAQPPVLRTEIEYREYAISALCGPCWDTIFPPEEGEE